MPVSALNSVHAQGWVNYVKRMTLPDGKRRVFCSLDIPENWKNEDGEWEEAPIQVYLAFKGQVGNIAYDYLRNKQFITIEGRLDVVQRECKRIGCSQVFYNTTILVSKFHWPPREAKGLKRGKVEGEEGATPPPSEPE